MAISLQFAEELKGPCPEVSYSFRLAPFKNEFLYEHWFHCHIKYLKDILGRIDNHNVCGTDIKSYYVNIRQAQLLVVLRKRQNASTRCHDLLAATMMRDCHPPHCTGYGLLQGHAISGLLSNVMLQPVDDKLVNQHSMRGRYFRYTDDITITGTDSLTQALDRVQQELSRLDKALELNHQKTFQCNQQEYRMKTMGGSGQLNLVGKRFGAELFQDLLERYGKPDVSEKRFNRDLI